MGVALTGKFAVAGSFAIVYLYAAEVFPTEVRNIAMGVVTMGARAGGILAPLVLLLVGDLRMKIPAIALTFPPSLPLPSPSPSSPVAGSVQLRTAHVSDRSWSSWYRYPELLPPRNPWPANARDTG